MRILTFLILFLACTFSSITGCRKFVQVPPPDDNIIGDGAFADDQTATSTITGLYIRMMGNTGSGQFATAGTSICLGLYADELNFLSSSPSLIDQYQDFYYNSINPSNNNFRTRFWQNPFNYLYHINACIEGLNRTLSVSDALKMQLLGEMKFMRAFIYFYLVNEFGDVPLITSTDYRINSRMPRTPVAQVYVQIVKDLLEAQNQLTINYPSQGKARPNKLAATALLARIYLYMEDWSNAISSSSQIISSGQYNLVSNLNNVFLLNSNEAILQFPTATASIVNTYDGNLLIPGSATSIPGLPVTTYLLNTFESGDQRKTSWLKGNTVSGQTYFYPYKYKLRTNTTPAAEANIIMRLAEIYLIRAEASAHNNNLVQAQTDLNMVRNRAGLPNTNANTQNSLLEAIEKERQLELFTEWGHRWFDIKRTNRAHSILSMIKGVNWQITDALFPIPDNELSLNPFLTQNPGY